MPEAKTSAFRVQQTRGLRGTLTMPGDKSIAHRAAMLAPFGQGSSQIRNWLPAGDTEATLAAMQAMGAQVERHDARSLSIHGAPLQAPQQPLNLKNAGTGIRLLAGLLAGQPFASTLDGSAQLRRRPMRRITEPLRRMGARIDAQQGRCPLHIQPAALQGIDYAMPIASGQVKSALLLAGLFAESPTTVSQPGPARDHSERMLRAQGAAIHISENGKRITIEPGASLQPLDISIPGDLSSAAFPLVAALLTPESALTLRGVNLNPTRSGLLDVLAQMGADIDIQAQAEQAGEPVGDITLRSSQLRGCEVGGDTVVRMIDEFPVLMVAATQAIGTTTVRDAHELRVKETDRIAVMASELRKLGADVEEREDGFRVTGPQRLRGAVVHGHDDHRIAMSLTVAGLIAQGETVVQDAACAGDSYPGFAQALIRCGAELSIEPPQ